MASSAPATSAKVTVEVSLLATLARDLPKFMTLLLPPCIPESMNQKKTPMMISGRMLLSRLTYQGVFGTWSSYPFEILALEMASATWVPRGNA